MERLERIEKLAPALLPWFSTFGRILPWRENQNPYHVWISEIMLQQTRIEAVKPYYYRFIKEIPDIPSLADADPELLMKLWEGLGYYSRVRNLQIAAQQIMQEYGGVFPDNYEQILSLRGVGSYTAGAIASICFNRPIPAVDGNVLRVMARITGDRRSVSEERTKASVRAELASVYPQEDCGTFTQAIMELGEMVCIPNGTPNCDNCPCASFCFSRDGEWMEYPVKTTKKARRKEKITMLLLHCGDSIAVRKRENSGLLAGMWELPNVQGEISAEEAFSLVETWQCEPTGITEEPTKNHVFTHVEWSMRCYRINCVSMPENFQWVDFNRIKNEIPLPTAFRKFVNF